MELYVSFLPGGYYILFHRFISGHRRSIPLYQFILALYRLYSSPLPFNDVWYHCFYALGIHIYFSTQAYRQRTKAEFGRRSFLDGAYWTAILHSSIDDWRHFKRYDMAGR